MRIIFYTPANADHANVLPERHNEIAEDSWCLDMLGKANFPIALSMQGFDFEFLELAHKKMPRNVKFVSAPYNHALLNLLADDESLRAHAQWLVDHGRRGDQDTMFFPEFAVTSKVEFPETIVPVLGSLTYAYSDAGVGNIEPGPSELDRYKAVRWGDKLAVPMRHTGELLKRFFAFQRFWTDEALTAFIDELKRLADDPSDDVAIFVVDLEAPYIGSWHGKAVWERLFEAIGKAGLAGAFTTFAAEKDFWQREAVELENTDVFARQMQKWTGHQKQVNLLMELARLPAPATDVEHRLFARITTSDWLAALDVKHKPPVALTTDGAPVPIGYNEALIRACRICFDHVGRKGAVLAMKDLRRDYHYEYTPEGIYLLRHVRWLLGHCM